MPRLFTERLWCDGAAVSLNTCVIRDLCSFSLSFVKYTYVVFYLCSVSDHWCGSIILLRGVFRHSHELVPVCR